MTPDTLWLVEPGIEWEAAFHSMAHDLAAHGERRYVDGLADFPAYVQRLRADALGLDLPAGHVPQSTYWGIVSGEIVGNIRLRHRLTPALERLGGHVGYDVRPSRRGKGHATAMLALLLERARDLGLARVLITCDADNAASARVIEKNGGQLAERYYSAPTGRHVLRYWVDLEWTERPA